MKLNSQQTDSMHAYREFVNQEIVPYSDLHDQQGSTPMETIRKMASKGYLGAVVPKSHLGQDLDMVTFALLSEEIGRGSASLLSLLTVHGMVSSLITRWGTVDQKTAYLPKLAMGELVGAFALTEPEVGSNAKGIQTRAVASGDEYILNGTKKWISFGQVAGLYMILAQCQGQPTAFLVERDTPGFSAVPLTNLYGFRSAMLAELHLEDCRVPAVNMVGGIGVGLSHVVGTALDFGRYCIACGCVGLAQACLDASLTYVMGRKQGDCLLMDYQLIQQMIAQMMVNIRAARLLCHQAGFLKDSGDPNSLMEASIAKYFASTIATKSANDAFQIHGANACAEKSPLQRYIRDAKLMEIIEGSTQIQYRIISRYGYQHHRTN